MNEKVSVKETKELLLGVMVLTKLLLERFRDGFQMEDLPVVLSKLGFDPVFQEAVKGLQHLPKEFKDLDIAEGFELAQVVLTELPKVLLAGQKPK